MTDLVTAPPKASAVIAQLGGMSDDELDAAIRNVEQAEEVVAGVTRFARIERGRRTNSHERKVDPTSTFSEAEKKRRVEEMLVVRWYDNEKTAEWFVTENGWRKCVTEARNEGYGKPPVTKKKLSTGVAHPAAYSDPIIEAIGDALPNDGVVLDPFAGTGRIHEVATETRETVGVEIEPEWADLHENTQQGNALDLFNTTTINPESVDAIATSPTYGNRLADSHKAADPDTRRSYTHDIGHDLHEDNSGDLQWGDEYRTFHTNAYTETIKALKPGGVFILNISDHIRKGKPQGVPLWHAGILMQLGLEWVACLTVDTPRLRQGANSDARAPVEYVVTLRKLVA